MIISGLLHPLHPEISMQVLCTIPSIFPRLLWERICPRIKSFLRLQSFSWFSSTYCLIQWGYCWVKLDAYYSEQSKGTVKEKKPQRVYLIAPPTTFEVWYQITIAWYPKIITTLVITTNCGVSVGSTNNYYVSGTFSNALRNTQPNKITFGRVM